jgi:WD40 repeat protein
LATAYFDAGYTTILWDLNQVLQAESTQGLEKATVDGGPGLVFTNNGATFITAEERISFWDMREFPGNETLRQILFFPGHTELVESLALSPDQKLLASGSRDRKIKIWNMVSGQEMAVLGGHGKRIRSLAFSPDGRLLASAGDDGTVRIWGYSEGN